MKERRDISICKLLMKRIVATFELVSIVYWRNGQMFSLILLRTAWRGCNYAHFVGEETEAQWLVTELPGVKAGVWVQVFLASAPGLFPPSHTATQFAKIPASFLFLLLLLSCLRDWREDIGSCSTEVRKDRSKRLMLHNVARQSREEPDFFMRPSWEYKLVQSYWKTTSSISQN